MIINKIEFPIYMSALLLALIASSLNIYLELKNKTRKEYILYFLILFLSYCLFGGIYLSYTVNGKLELFSYTAAFTSLIAGITFEKIIPNKDRMYLKSLIISLPLAYSIAKIGCFLAGCCYGIPYNDIFSVTYTNGLNISLFPIQLLESLLFFILFIFLKKIKSKKHIVEISIICTCTLKYLTDFLRYEHINKIITRNQILSLLFILVVIIYSIYKNFKK